MWAALIMWTLVLALGHHGLDEPARSLLGRGLAGRVPRRLIGQHLLAVVVMHWAGVLSMSALLKQNLVRAMVTGGESSSETGTPASIKTEQRSPN